jgi:hypothetical protein
MPATRELGITPKGWELVSNAIKECGYNTSKICLKIEDYLCVNNSKWKAFQYLEQCGLKRFSDVAMAVETLREAG